jgi:hypothetical protein
MTADELPDVLNALKAMVLSGAAENARLRQIIKELQRHRFGRRAETLPEDHPPPPKKLGDQMNLKGSMIFKAPFHIERSCKAIAPGLAKRTGGGIVRYAMRALVPNAIEEDCVRTSSLHRRYFRFAVGILVSAFNEFRGSSAINQIHPKAT